MLTSQIRVLMEDLKEGRKERKKIQEEMKKRNKQVDEQEKMIRNLEALYGGRRDASSGRNNPTPTNLVRIIYPYQEMCQLECRRERGNNEEEIRACYSEEL